MCVSFEACCMELTGLGYIRGLLIGTISAMSVGTCCSMIIHNLVGKRRFHMDDYITRWFTHYLDSMLKRVAEYCSSTFDACQFEAP